jgi:hypothetical protein
MEFFMTEGVKTIIYPVKDLAKAKTLYSKHRRDPILDIKSYIPVLNRRDNIRGSEWVDLLGGRTSQDRDDRD